MVLLTADAANKRDSFQHCIYCSDKPETEQQDSKASRYARAAEPLMRSLADYPNSPAFIATESKVLKGRHGAFDFSCPLLTQWGLRWVHAEVDGETHFTKPRQGETVGAQREVDRNKDSAAWEGKHMLVRLHHADQGEWGEVLCRAVSLAKRQRPHRFILYTHSYGQLDLKNKVQAL